MLFLFLCLATRLTDCVNEVVTKTKESVTEMQQVSLVKKLENCSQPAFSCSNFRMEIPKQGVK